MKDFTSLTDLGKARRLRILATAALTEFGLDTSRLRLLCMATNTLFRVWTAGGETYVLRCCTPGWRTDTDLRSEVMWLEALARDTDIGAPVPLRAPDGDAFVRAFAEGVSGPIRCTLMSWIPGVSLGRRLSVTTLTQMGALFARMHAHGAAFVPPEGFTTRHMNTYLAREELNVLFGPECLAALPHESQELLALTRAKVDAAFESRYAASEGLRVIHNDLWHDNIKLHRGRLRPLDFEDTLWGYPVQDIAMAWLDLMDSVASGLYEPYTDAFRAGYESHTPWPERFAGEVDLFEAGRMLWVANYVARYQPQHLGAHIEWLSPRLASFLASGRVRHLPASV